MTTLHGWVNSLVSEFEFEPGKVANAAHFKTDELAHGRSEKLSDRVALNLIKSEGSRTGQ